MSKKGALEVGTPSNCMCYMLILYRGEALEALHFGAAGRTIEPDNMCALCSLEVQGGVKDIQYSRSGGLGDGVHEGGGRKDCLGRAQRQASQPSLSLICLPCDTSGAVVSS